MFAATLKNGFISGLKCCWFLMKIIIPVYLVVTIMKHTPVMDFLMSLLHPVMSLFHLPGEAAVPFITGIFLDEYSTIAAIKAIGLSGFAVSVVALMNLMAHSLFIETAILKKLDLSITFFTVYRLITASVVGLVIGWGGVLFGQW